MDVLLQGGVEVYEIGADDAVYMQRVDRTTRSVDGRG